MAIVRVFTSILVKELEDALNRKDGYIMGSKGQNPRTGQMNLKSTVVKSSWKENGWFYTQYSGAQRTQALKWRKNCTRVWDCNGMAEGIYELHTGVNIDSKARYNYAQWCNPKGPGLIPAKYRVPGAAVFWSKGKAGDIHHVAYLYKPVKEGHPEGDWYIIEAKGVMYGVVKSKLNSRKPNFWGWMTKYYDYEASGSADVPEEETKGFQTLRNGDDGKAVQDMQSGLIRLGFSCGKWGADGDFGDATELAVREFQKSIGMKENGEWTEECQKKMDELLSNTVDSPTPDPKKVKIVNGQCYVRSKPSTSGSKLGVAKEGEVFPYAGETSQDEWNKIDFRGTEGWVSGKYSKLVK